MSEFNQKEYIRQYRKEHYSRFNVEIPKEEKEELDKLLKEKQMTRRGFIRYGYDKLKKEKNSRFNANNNI